MIYLIAYKEKDGNDFMGQPYILGDFNNFDECKENAQQLIGVWDNDPFMPDGTADLVDPVLILQGDLLLADIDPKLLGRSHVDA